MISFRLTIDSKEYVSFGLSSQLYEKFIKKIMEYLGISGNPEDDIFGDYILNNEKLYVQSYMKINEEETNNESHPVYFYDSETQKKYLLFQISI